MKFLFHLVSVDLHPVTPFAGVWIEITNDKNPINASILSLPSRECGLKFLLLCYIISNFCVTPFAGVWIEIIELRMSLENGSSITNIK